MINTPIMLNMTKMPVIPGVWWIDIPKADLRVLCGAPMDSIKHLMRHGLVRKIESGGVVYETGPNAILLSDITIQKGRFWNLAEFPYLHMLFRQGMGIPGHPGNTGNRPIIAGLRERCEGVLGYIYRGTYGLVSRDEMRESGVPEADIEELWKLKLKFAGGSVKTPDELVDVIAIGRGKSEIKNGVGLRRDSPNVYTFEYAGESLQVDMNLPEDADWTASYTLLPIETEDGYFSVTHIGEGNGWDPDRPCMGSLVTYRGSRYLIDAGPGIDYSLESLGIDVAEICGLLFTHAHDDHFAGLTSLLRGGRRMTVYATRPVMATVRLKCAALLERDPSFFDELIDVRYLQEDLWNDIDGLEVRPTTSPHPLETTIMYFRALWEGGYRSYAHLADIISLSVLDSFISEDGISRAFYDRICGEYARMSDVKKIDAGRGMIHGSAEDFSEDPSPRLILSHTEGGLSAAEKQLGAGVRFGQVDILIPDRGDRLREQAAVLLDRAIPGMARDDYGLLLNGKVQRIPPGTPLLKKGASPDRLQLIISGTVERLGSGGFPNIRYAAGSIIGESEFFSNRKAMGTYRSLGHLKVLRLPSDIYVHALSRVNHVEKRTSVLERVEFLASGPFPGSVVTCPRLYDLAYGISEKTLRKGGKVKSGKDELYIVLVGTLRPGDAENSHSLGSGSYFNLSSVIPITGNPDPPSWSVSEPGRIGIVKGALIREIPSLFWTLAEGA